MPHKKGHVPPSSPTDTTFTASSIDMAAAKKKLSSKVRKYGKNPNKIKFTRNNKTGKYTASTTVKKLKKGGQLTQYD